MFAITSMASVTYFSPFGDSFVFSIMSKISGVSTYLPKETKVEGILSIGGFSTKPLTSVNLPFVSPGLTTPYFVAAYLETF